MKGDGGNLGTVDVCSSIIELSARSDHAHAGGPDDWFGHKAVVPATAGRRIASRRGAITPALRAPLDTDADDQQLATLVKLTERYCVVYQTLAGAPALSTTLATG